MIEIRGLTVAFGAVVAVDALDAVLDAPVCGLIGPNGAGKTTLVNLLSGFVRAKAGSVAMRGVPLLPMSCAQRVRFGLRRSFQTEQVVDDLSAWDNVHAMLDHVPHTRAEAAAQVHAALAHAGLLDVAAVPGAALDLFRRRMVEVAKALVLDFGRRLALGPTRAVLDDPAVRQAYLGT